MVEYWSMIILLGVLGLKPYLQKPQTKKIKPKFPSHFSADSVKQIWQRPVERPLHRRAKLCMCAHRPTPRVDRELVSALCLFRSTERPTVLPPTVRNMTVDGRPPCRPVVVRKVWQTPTAIFSDRFFVGISPPTNPLSCYLVFSTPINSGSFQHDKTKIRKEFLIRFSSFSKPI